jgi:arginine utilization protein RocB
MRLAKWGTPTELRQLLQELVSWKSVTLSEGERLFPKKLKKKLQELSYFQKYTDQLVLHDADLGRQFLTALYKHPLARKTICLISHFDTVGTEEYGDMEGLATEPKELTNLLFQKKKDLPPEALKDLESGEYLFGRGTMDMKMGLATHMQLLEKAILENWPINLLLLTVPDEEVNSAGMRAAVPKLVELKEAHQLDYILFLNSEPVFTQGPNEHCRYLYSGTIGKAMPAALFYGKATHAGEPLSGLTSPYIASYLTREMEWNTAFQETSFGETTPLPVTLQQRDLTSEYSTKTPYRSSALYNVFLMEQSATGVFHTFEEIAEVAAEKLNKDYSEVCRLNGVAPIGKVTVIRYENLLAYATKKLGKKAVDQIRTTVQSHQEWDEREKSLRIADQFIMACKELAPAIVILLAPPYYPAANSSENKLIETCVDFVKQRSEDQFNFTMERIHYFNGISDLSYVADPGDKKDWKALGLNTPVWNDSYTIPFRDMQKLRAPVLNIGPFGKDAHKWTERLHMKNAFEEVPILLEEMIQMLSKK